MQKKLWKLEKIHVILYLHVVLPSISIIQLHSFVFSRLLKGLTLTATFTEDMMNN